MDYWALLGIAAGLSMDAFAVSLSNGAVTRNLKWKHAFVIAITFGLFQAAMPVAGWAVGVAGKGIIESVDHWIAFILLGYIGGKMIYDSLQHTRSQGEAACRCQEPPRLKALIVMAVATSIDALATGVILPSVVGASSLQTMLLAVGIIGAVTFLICFAGVFIGKKFGDLFSCKAELFGGLVLVFIGGKILVEHLWLS